MPKLNHFFLRLLRSTLAIFILCLNTFPAQAEWKLNMPVGVTSVSRDIYHLHMLILWVCVAIGVIVFSVMIYALIYHRKSRGAVAAEFHSHPVLEIVWAVIPFFILVAMAIPATKVLIDMDDTTDSDVTIRITGYQWKWKYDYLDEGLSFFSQLSTPIDQIKQKAQKNPNYLLEVDRELVLPVGQKIRFLLTSNDVIHAWWVPELGIKRDALPGIINEAWARIDKEGIYRGQCAELCGIHHAYMPIVVKAVSKEAYQAWLKTQKKAPEDVASVPATNDANYETLMRLGKAGYERHCAACHKDNGLGDMPFYPALKGSSITTDQKIDRHLDVILNGVKDTAMQAFKEQLSDLEIAAIATYERNAWENNTGDLIQASDVAARRAANHSPSHAEKANHESR